MLDKTGLLVTGEVTREASVRVKSEIALHIHNFGDKKIANIFQNPNICKIFWHIPRTEAILLFCFLKKKTESQKLYKCGHIFPPLKAYFKLFNFFFQ